MCENYIKDASVSPIVDICGYGYIDELLREADKLIMEYKYKSPNNCLQNKNSCECNSSESETEKEFMELKKLGKCVGDFGGKFQDVLSK